MKYIASLFSLLIAFFLIIPASAPEAAPALDNRACTPGNGKDIVVVFDNGPTLTDKAQYNYRFSGAKKFIDTLQEYDRSSIVKFNTGAEILQSLSSEKDSVKSAIDRIKPESNTGSFLGEGIKSGLGEFKKSSRNNEKIMIVLTDGGSPDNEISKNLARQAALEEVQINVIALGSDSPTDSNYIADWNVLKEMTDETGGKIIKHMSSVNGENEILKNFQSIMQGASGSTGGTPDQDGSPWVLTRDLTTDDLVIAENMVMDLNGYNLTVNGNVTLLSCSELRAVNGEIQVSGNLVQEAGAYIRLNNSQLNVENTFTQQGFLRVNGDFASEPEIKVGQFKQQSYGSLDLNGYEMNVRQTGVTEAEGLNERDKGSFQRGNISLGGGTMSFGGDFRQQGWFDVAGGELLIEGNLTINGGTLMDPAFKENKSLNVNGGYVRVGSEAAGLGKGNVYQESGQLYVNYGVVDIFSNYRITDGWLTMIHAAMDTTSTVPFVDEGDYVHVRGNFSMQSMRNHAARQYTQLGQPMSDQGHLTNGILQVDGDFEQVGNQEYHTAYSDRSQQYLQPYSRYNFTASGKHKVWLTGENTSIKMESPAATFQILQVKGALTDFTRNGVRWKQLIETATSADTTLSSLSINDVPVLNFSPNVTDYIHAVPADTIEGGQLPMLKVDARPSDRNAKVQVTGNTIGAGGRAEVKVLVTAADGSQRVYTVEVSAGGEVPGKVTGITTEQKEIVFKLDSSTTPASYKPDSFLINYTVTPNNAYDKGVSCESLDTRIATAAPQASQSACMVTATAVQAGETSIRLVTNDGKYAAYVKVRIEDDAVMLNGIKTLADLVSDTKRYNEIVSLYDTNHIGISVPGRYIDNVKVGAVDRFVTGTINITDPNVDRVAVRINGQQLLATEISPGTFIFNRTGLSFNDYVEVIAFENGEEKERIGRPYIPGVEQLYVKNTAISSGNYSLRSLMTNPATFANLLDHYSMEELMFVPDM